MKVKLELFEGPMDLLLYLIKRDHIDIHDIPIARVLEQYLEYLELMKLCDINVASEYMVIAATLIQIKSRMLLPRTAEAVEQGEEEDPRDELVRRLLEYQRYKDVADFLRNKEVAMHKHITRPDTISAYRPSEIYFEASIFDLITAFKAALKDVPKDVFFQVIKDEFTVEQKVAHISDLVEAYAQVSIHELFREARSKLEIVATFLAVLELIKQKTVSLFQKGNFGEIIVTRYTEETAIEVPDDGLSTQPE